MHACAYRLGSLLLLLCVVVLLFFAVPRFFRMLQTVSIGTYPRVRVVDFLKQQVSSFSGLSESERADSPSSLSLVSEIRF